MILIPIYSGMTPKRYTDAELLGLLELVNEDHYSWFSPMAVNLINELIQLRKEINDLKDPFVEESE